ncbi:VOC family protein [Arhodomonas sp. AD133]|uniref:VOC family protein n=1 Tax=Arhodomonas sp. AD133 TaxID=3415009 RepID=UPI003EBF988A
MSVQLNHTIVWCRDKRRSAGFLSQLLDLPEPRPFGPMLVVALDNGVSLDFHEKAGHVAPQHYAFLTSEEHFDRIFTRLRDRGLPYWAGPDKQHPGEINHDNGGRGVYFEDPDSHLLEIITRPYGSSDAGWEEQATGPRLNETD